MTDHEAIQLRQESTINKLRADLAEARTKIARLENMHRNNQKYIDKLSEQIKDSAFDRADRVFRSGE